VKTESGELKLKAGQNKKLYKGEENEGVVT
jgi:hypothetical protein